MSDHILERWRESVAARDPVAVSFVEQIIADASLEIARGAEVGAIATVVDRALAGARDSRERGRRVYKALLDSPLVDELYLTDNALPMRIDDADL